MLERIDPAKDADGLHPTCTPRGIVELVRRYDVPLAGAHVVVIGRGTTSGRPLGLLLMVRPGATVLDVGTTRVLGEDGRARIVGDTAADVREVAGWLAPMPGGIGPMTRAMLLANVVEAAERAMA